MANAKWYLATEVNVKEPFRTIRYIFRDVETPTKAKYPHITSVVGPFRTKRGALYMEKHGRNNVFCQTVAQAERMAKLRGLDRPSRLGLDYIR